MANPNSCFPVSSSLAGASPVPPLASAPPHAQRVTLVSQISFELPGEFQCRILTFSLSKFSCCRRLIKGTGKGEFVQKKAPEYCEVTIVYDGKKLTAADSQKVVPSAVASDQRRRPEIATRQPERNFLDCICFSAKSD
ncbi:hypothetical protein C3L33_00655, partial [Rhododendron williamsianum]